MRIQKDTVRKFMVPDDGDKAWVKIKHLTKEEFEHLSLTVTEQSITYDTNGRNPRIEQSSKLDAIQSEILKQCIVDWGNFYGSDGKQAPCTPENIELFSRKGKGFKAFIMECRATLAEDIEKEKKEQEKN